MGTTETHAGAKRWSGTTIASLKDQAWVVCTSEAKPRRPVEKVVVGSVGSPREPENKAKTLRKHRVQPVIRGRREREGVFQHAVELRLGEGRGL